MLAALHKAIPPIPPTGREYLSHIDTMYPIAGQLSQLPGRKNVLWFSGGSTLYPREDATFIDDPQVWRVLYDERGSDCKQDVRVRDDSVSITPA